MKRLALLAALLVCTPALAPAQADPPAPRPRLTVTPYVGVRGPFGGEDVVQVFTPESVFLLEEERSGSATLGAELALRVFGPISLVAGGSYGRTGQVRFFESDTTFFREPELVHSRGDAMWLGKLGLSARFESPRSLTELRARPSTDLFVGAGVVEEFDDLHPALNLGFQGAIEALPGVEFVLGVEDYLVFWDQKKLSGEVAAIVSRFYADQDVQGVTLHYDLSNIFQVRVGGRLTLR